MFLLNAPIKLQNLPMSKPELIHLEAATEVKSDLCS